MEGNMNGKLTAKAQSRITNEYPEIEVLDDKAIAHDAMQQTNQLIENYLDQLLSSGRIATKQIEDMKDSKVYKRLEKQQEARKKLYHNTEMLLKNYNGFKIIEKEWRTRLADMLEFESEGYSQSELLDALKDVIDFERPGYKQISNEYARMNSEQAKLRYMEMGLQILQGRENALDQRHYLILKNAFLDDVSYQNGDQEWERLKIKYHICENISCNKTYYKYRKDAIKALSKILFAEETTDSGLMNMVAVILYELACV